MFSSLVREFHWPPSVLEGLFFDGEDYRGLFFWYNDIKEMHDEVDRKKNAK
jgi:hypothetical protein